MRYFDPNTLSPRELRCNTCGDLVTVIEHPVIHIDPRRYRCDLCREGRPPGQMIIGDAQRTDHVGYDNTMAMIPY